MHRCFALLTGITALIFLSALCQLHAEDAFRMWTDITNRQVEASFAGFDGSNVSFKMRDGSVVPFPIAKLSPADQEWVKQHPAATSTPAPTPAASKPSTPAPSSGPVKPWPHSTGLDEAPKATVVKEDNDAKEFIYRTPNFEFHCDSKLGSDVV